MIPVSVISTSVFITIQSMAEPPSKVHPTGKPENDRIDCWASLFPDFLNFAKMLEQKRVHAGYPSVVSISISGRPTR